MLEIQRKREIIEKLYQCFYPIEEGCFISTRDISFIFRGGRYAIEEIKEIIKRKSESCLESEQLKIINKKISRHGMAPSYFDYYINLPFLASIITDITDDDNDISAFNFYASQNMETLDTTTPQECEVSLITSNG